MLSPGLCLHSSILAFIGTPPTSQSLSSNALSATHSQPLSASPYLFHFSVSLTNASHMSYLATFSSILAFCSQTPTAGTCS